jgi:hypothetical protein
MNMKTNERNGENDGISPSFKQICLASCRTLLAQIESAKNAILAEFRNLAGVRERMLRLAVNEAEALAWQTEYPHLLFPTLAKEKAEEVIAWHARAESIQSTPFVTVLAA